MTYSNLLKFRNLYLNRRRVVTYSEVHFFQSKLQVKVHSYSVALLQQCTIFLYRAYFYCISIISGLILLQLHSIIVSGLLVAGN